MIISISWKSSSKPKKQNIKKDDLIKSHMKPSGKKGTGDIQPPKNKIDARKEIKIIFAYSARKNSKKPFQNTQREIQQQFQIHLQPHQKEPY